MCDTNRTTDIYNRKYRNIPCRLCLSRGFENIRFITPKWKHFITNDIGFLEGDVTNLFTYNLCRWFLFYSTCQKFCSIARLLLLLLLFWARGGGGCFSPCWRIATLWFCKLCCEVDLFKCDVHGPKNWWIVSFLSENLIPILIVFSYSQLFFA